MEWQWHCLLTLLGGCNLQLCAFICVTSLEYPAETAFAAMKSLRGKLEALRASRDVDVEQCRAKALNKPLKLSFDELRDKCVTFSHRFIPLVQLPTFHAKLLSGCLHD